jgi:hypothetical protein
MFVYVMYTCAGGESPQQSALEEIKELLKRKTPSSARASKINKEELSSLRDALGLKLRPDSGFSFKDLMNVRPHRSAFCWCALLGD